MALAVLILAGLGLLAVGAAALVLTVQAAAPDAGVIDLPLGATGTGLSTQRLFLAYAGSSAGIAGAACMVMAVLLSTVHRVVPARTRHTGRRPYETRLAAPTRG